MFYLSERNMDMGFSRWIRDEEFYFLIENIDVIKQVLRKIGFKLVLLEKNGEKRELSEEEFEIVMLYIRTFGSCFGCGTKGNITVEKMKKRLGILEIKGVR
jgi:hypothetical protein